MKPDLSFADQVSELSHQNVQRCFYCLRCSAGCPAAYAMDYTPAQILRLVQLGQKDTLLHSSAIWLCIGCETCGTRCPNSSTPSARSPSTTTSRLPSALSSSSTRPSSTPSASGAASTNYP